MSFEVPWMFEVFSTLEEGTVHGDLIQIGYPIPNTAIRKGLLCVLQIHLDFWGSGIVWLLKSLSAVIHWVLILWLLNLIDFLWWTGLFIRNARHALNLLVVVHFLALAVFREHLVVGIVARPPLARRAAYYPHEVVVPMFQLRELCDERLLFVTICYSASLGRSDLL